MVIVNNMVTVCIGGGHSDPELPVGREITRTSPCSRADLGRDARYSPTADSAPTVCVICPTHAPSAGQLSGRSVIHTQLNRNITNGNDKQF